jgi:2-aminobenzoate-CoA ligase
VLRGGVAGDAAKAREIQDYVKGQLAPYKYPRVVRFTASLPRNASGKVQHFKLREVIAAQPGAAGAGADGTGATEAVATEGGA